MPELINRGLSALIAAAYVVAAAMHGSGTDLLVIIIALLLPLACIWFPDAMGSHTGLSGLQSITSNTPAIAVRVGGWFLLVVVPIVLYVVMASNRQP